MGATHKSVTGTSQAACELHATKVAPGESNG